MPTTLLCKVALSRLSVKQRTSQPRKAEQKNFVNFRLSLPELLVAVLAVWRGTHLLWGEDGMFNIFLRLRKLAGAGYFGQLLDCFYCLSLWLAFPAP